MAAGSPACGAVVCIGRQARLAEGAPAAAAAARSVGERSARNSVARGLASLRPPAACAAAGRHARRPRPCGWRRPRPPANRSGPRRAVCAAVPAHDFTVGPLGARAAAGRSAVHFQQHAAGRCRPPWGAGPGCHQRVQRHPAARRPSPAAEDRDLHDEDAQRRRPWLRCAPRRRLRVRKPRLRPASCRARRWPDLRRRV